MKGRLRKIQFFALISIGLFCVLYVSILAKANANTDGRLRMNVTINFNQLVKYNRYANVRVEVENQNVQEFQGYLQAILETEEGPEDCMYQTEFLIRRNMKRYINIALPIKEGVKKVRFRIANREGKVVTEIEKILKLETETESFYLGVVGDGKEYIKNLEGIVLKTIEIPENEIPDVEEGLDTFEAILISNHYLDSSSLEQLSTIRSWCRAGGTIMIGKMDLAAKNFFGVSYKPSEVVSNQDGERIYQIYKMEDGILFEWVHGDDFLYDIKSAPYYVENSIYDINTYYSRFNKQRHYHDEYSNHHAENQLIRSLEGGDKRYLPKAMVYGAIMVLYAFVVGPILYSILRKREKNMFYYIGVCIFAGVFSSAIWIVGQNTRISKPILNSITIYKYEENSSKFKESSYISINVPVGKQERITVEKKTNIEMKNVSVRSKNNEDCQVVIDKRVNDSRIDLKKPLYMKSYVFKSTAKQGRSGSILYDLQFDGKGIKGTITNNLGFELENAVLISNYHIVKLGELPEGKEKKVPSQQKVVNQYSFYMNIGELANDLTGIDGEESKGDLAAVRKHAATVYALSQECFDYGNESYIVGFIKGNEEGDVRGFSRRNLSLVIYSLRNLETIYYGKPLITDIECFKKVTSGHISTATRVMNSDSAVVMYRFPSGMKINALLYLKNLNDSDSFHGVISVWNNNTKEYDTLFQGDDIIIKMENDKYISTDNSIIIKYTSYSQMPGTNVEAIPILSALEEVQ